MKLEPWILSDQNLKKRFIMFDEERDQIYTFKYLAILQH